MFSSLTKLLDSFLDLGIPGYDCLVYHKGAPIYRRTAGYSDMENRIPMNGRERYNIYSCSKPITVTAALQLWERGLFSLDDPLAAYMPEFSKMSVRAGETIRPAKNKITVRDLFTMSAGFHYNTSAPWAEVARQATAGKCPTRETVRHLAAEPLDFEPHTKWQYSLCHDVLAALVEVLSGERFEEYVHKHIFAPLGMHRSTFLLPDTELDTVCAQYTGYFDRPDISRVDGRILHYKLGPAYASGGAGCVSTVEDYILFLEALRRGDTILKAQTVDMMATPVSLPGTLFPSEYGYGLGVRCPCGGKNTDFGWMGAAGGYLAVDKIHDFTVIYLQHVLGNQMMGKRLLIGQTVRSALTGAA